MATFITRIVELGIHTLEEAEQDALFEVLRAELSLMRQRPAQISSQIPTGSQTYTNSQTHTGSQTTKLKKASKLMAVNQTTDDQVFTQTFSLADADLVPVDGSSSPVSVSVVDADGADLSKWIDVQQDTANPLKFVYSRKPDADGLQPQDLAFTAIGTAVVGGAPSEFRQDLMFTPGAATSLTATVTSGPASGGNSGAENGS